MKCLLFIMLFLFLCLDLFAPTNLFISSIHEDVYFPQHASRSAAGWNLLEQYKDSVDAPIYKRKGKITFCNVFARDVLDARYPHYLGKIYGYLFDFSRVDVSCVFPDERDILRLSITQAYKKSELAFRKGVLKSHTAKMAQARANEGYQIWVISSKYRHECLVAPNFSVWDDKKGCLIVQAGWYNGIYYISDYEVFGNTWTDPEIRFYEFPEVGYGK